MNSKWILYLNGNQNDGFVDDNITEDLRDLWLGRVLRHIRKAHNF